MCPDLWCAPELVLVPDVWQTFLWACLFVCACLFWGAMDYKLLTRGNVEDMFLMGKAAVQSFPIGRDLDIDVSVWGFPFITSSMVDYAYSRWDERRVLGMRLVRSKRVASAVGGQHGPFVVRVPLGVPIRTGPQWFEAHWWPEDGSPSVALQAFESLEVGFALSVM